MRSSRFNKGILAPAMLIACISQGHSQSNAELMQVRQEMEQLKEDYAQMRESYEVRLKKLDERLQRLEDAAPQAALLSAAVVTTRRPPVTQATAPAADQAPQFAKTQENPGLLPFEEPTDSIQISRAEEEKNAVQERMETVLQNFVDVKGYFRAGYGRDNEGGPQVAFQAPGALAKGRLGNEAENYGELTFSKSFFLPGAFSLNRNSAGGHSGKPIASFQTTISMYNPYQNYNAANDTTFGIAEAWGAIGDLVASQPAMNVWAGNRFYRRHDIYINDFMMYNMSGGGAGVEDVRVPFGKIALAWIGIGSQSAFSDTPQPNPENKAGFSKQNLDLRLYDVKLPGGSGEIGVDVSHESSGRDQTGNTAPNSTGASFTFIHTAEKWAGESNMNKFFIQYGHGPAKTFTSGFETYAVDGVSFIRPDASGSYRFRIADNMIFETGKYFTMSPVVLYQLTDYKQYGGRQQWFSAGVRPQAQLNSYLSLAFEPFVDWTDDESKNISDSLFKFTFAPQVTLGRHFMSRPAIRAFVTYAQWGNGFKGQIGGPDYANSTSGVTWGAQMESWW